MKKIIYLLFVMSVFAVCKTDKVKVYEASVINNGIVIKKYFTDRSVYYCQLIGGGGKQYTIYLTNNKHVIIYDQNDKTSIILEQVK